MSPITIVLILGCGSWFNGRWFWFDGPMVMGGGGNGSMVGDCGLTGMGCGSWCSVFNGTVGFGPGLHRSTGGGSWMVGCGFGS